MRTATALVLVGVIGCDGPPPAATAREVEDLSTQVATLQAQLQAEINERRQADAENSAALEALASSGGGGGGSTTTPEPLRTQLEDVQGRLSVVEEWIDTSGRPTAFGLAAVQSTLDELSMRIDVAQATLDAAQADLVALEGDSRALLSYVEVDHATDAIVFSGANVFVQSGRGATDAAPNGVGNLIVGYDEGEPAGKRGSHNLVVGAGHAYPTWGSVVFGQDNAALGDASSVLGGENNVAGGARSVVVGGLGNESVGPSDIAP